MRARMQELLRFIIVGGIAFVVDAGLLELLVSTGLATFVARIFSIAAALQVSYVLHGGFTYREHAGYSKAGWLKFMASNLIGNCLNYAMFVAALSLTITKDARDARLIALVAATLVAMCFNYWANRRFAFRHERQS